MYLVYDLTYLSDDEHGRVGGKDRHKIAWDGHTDIRALIREEVTNKYTKLPGTHNHRIIVFGLIVDRQYFSKADSIVIHF